MAITKGPEALICSARGCEELATGAIIWSNPKLHFGRHKTWLTCPEHREFLTNYLGYRRFPVEYLPLDEFLAREEAAEADQS
ncbi:hypothetical protein [Scrofimicrobium sp. R131]|uniref:Acetone carboxylase n=1 Tax=Scrofimicrobium appendicitidis TaxID=3079930 RepID=A0AAU7V9D0_9ACTO